MVSYVWLVYFSVYFLAQRWNPLDVPRVIEHFVTEGVVEGERHLEIGVFKVKLVVCGAEEIVD